MEEKKDFIFDPLTNFLGILILFLPVFVILFCLIFCPAKEEKKTHTYTMGGYAVNSVTIETEDWNVWRVHGYEMIEDEYYIVTFDDNGTMNVDDDIILNIEKANPPKN